MEREWTKTCFWELLNSSVTEGRRRACGRGASSWGFLCPPVPVCLRTYRTCVGGARLGARYRRTCTFSQHVGEYRLRQEINHLSICDQWKWEDGDVKFASKVAAAGPERPAHGARSGRQPMKPASRPGAPQRRSGMNGCLACRFHHPAKKKMVESGPASNHGQKSDLQRQP